MGLSAADLPPAVREGLGRLFADGLYFVPVRHHSPACAYALQALLREVRPAAVLIEGPDHFDALLPLLQDERTRPPVAVLTQRLRPSDDDGSASRSAFYPLCDYSPEWVALREARALGARAAFIDLPWNDEAQWADEEGNGSLQAERYLAHSRWLGALAARSGCRDHHELWDHLFELRPAGRLADWRRLFADVFGWCAMARLDYEPEVLEAEGSLPRERHMARWIRHWRERVDGPVVVVTGGFHTLQLLDWATAPAAPAPGVCAEQWLIRYGFEALDALNDYAAGMPSPAYHQAVWEGLQAGKSDPWLHASHEFLLELARRTRELGLADALSTADVQAATLQALRLADLRGHAGPGRTDLLDALTSCFIKGLADDGTAGLLRDARRLLSGKRFGDVPPSAGSPPLLEEARRQARACGIRLDDSERRTARLDLYRKPAHARRSRFFQRMSYLGVPLARWEAGPDFLAGSRLDSLFEEWSYAWTPSVEARLIELSGEGASLEEAALRRIRAEEAALAAAGHGRSAARAVSLLLRACLIGLHGRLPALFALIRTHLDEDADFGSVVQGAHQLLTLTQAREPLGLRDDAEVESLIERAWNAALFLLPGLAATRAEAEEATIRQLLSLREIGRRLAARSDSFAGDRLAGRLLELLPRSAGVSDRRGAGMTADQRACAASNQGACAATDRGACAATDRGACAPGIEGAAAALLYLDGRLDGPALAGLLGRSLGTGAAAERAAGFLGGLLQAAPELIVREPALLYAFNPILAAWDEEVFVAFLPELRRAFTRLNPRETDQLARQVLDSVRASGEPTLTARHDDLSETDLLEGLSLQRRLDEALRADGLDAWVGPEETCA